MDFDRFMGFRKPEDFVSIDTDDEFKRLFSQQEYLRNQSLRSWGLMLAV